MLTVHGFAMPCLRQRNLILTQNFIKMKKSTTETFKHGIAKPMLSTVAIFAKNNFKN